MQCVLFLFQGRVLLVEPEEFEENTRVKTISEGTYIDLHSILVFKKKGFKLQKDM